MVESIATMNSELATEKRAVQRMWAKRQTQIDNVSSTVASVVGQISAIAHGEIPALETINALALPMEVEE